MNFEFVLNFFLLAQPMTQAASMHCADVNSVAQEAVAYHLTGAGTTDLPLDCAKKTKWQYFNPKIEPKSNEPYNNPDYIWFEPQRDKYVIDKLSQTAAGYDIEVTFTIKGKNIPVKYLYVPNDQMQKYVGVCGTITKPKKPWIFRADCKAPDKTKK